MPHPVLQHVGGVVYSPTVADIQQLIAYISETAKFVESFTLGVPPETWIETLIGLLPPGKSCEFRNWTPARTS